MCLQIFHSKLHNTCGQWRDKIKELITEEFGGNRRTCLITRKKRLAHLVYQQSVSLKKWGDMSFENGAC